MELPLISGFGMKIFAKPQTMYMKDKTVLSPVQSWSTLLEKAHEIVN